ncbi:hypothetical protein [Telmatospirillum sp. J64-1]|uniref:phage neck terminator protein n=1 Tax=Telmatospirillum sp. J64-1 TaxID=2502183 RepID=UPI00115E32C2|nr:hypothetical protein [Telmatospirillum sp. J64-1]
MSNNSATGGPLAVEGGLSREALEDVIHDLLAGLTGLEGALIRPRYQPKPPPQPKPEVDWCAFGITEAAPEGTQLIQGDGAAVLHSQASLTVALSFYGPGGDVLAGRVRAGLQIAQNREGLRAAGLAYVSAGAIIAGAELVGGSWLPRFDLTLTLRQAEALAVAIENLACGRHQLIANS